MLLNASVTYPYEEAATGPTTFYKELLLQKSAFKVKQLMDQELHDRRVNLCISASLAAAILIAKLSWTVENKPDNLTVFSYPQMSSAGCKESELKRYFWIYD